MHYWLTRWVAVFIFKVFFKGRVIGRQNIPLTGGFILASNHLSFLDPVVMGIASPRKLSYMARDSLFRNFWFGLLIRLYNAFPVRRGSPDRGALKDAQDRLARGQGLLMFPEGSRSADFRGNPKAGVGFLACRMQVPVIPAFIQGTDKALPKGGRWLRRFPITVFLGSPLYFRPGVSYEDFSRQVISRIYELGGKIE